MLTYCFKYFIGNSAYFIDILNKALVINVVLMLIRVIPSHNFLLSLFSNLCIKEVVLTKWCFCAIV